MRPRPLCLGRPLALTPVATRLPKGHSGGASLPAKPLARGREPCRPAAKDEVGATHRRLRNDPISSQNRPSHEAFVVEGEGKATTWTKIGAAWPHDGRNGLIVKLSALPLNGRLVLRAPKPKADGEGETGA
jgi:hypothetical protein